MCLGGLGEPGDELHVPTHLSVLVGWGLGVLGYDPGVYEKAYRLLERLDSSYAIEVVSCTTCDDMLYFRGGKARIVVRDPCSRGVEDIAASILSTGLRARLASILALIATGLLLLLSLVFDIALLTMLVGILGASLWALDLAVERRSKRRSDVRPPVLFVERLRAYIDAYCTGCERRPPGAACRTQDNSVVVEYARPIG